MCLHLLALFHLSEINTETLFPFVYTYYTSLCVSKQYFYSMKTPILIMFIQYTFIFQSRPQPLVHFLWTEKSLHWPGFSKWTEPEIQCICYMHILYMYAYDIYTHICVYIGIYMQLLSPLDWIPQHSQSYADVGMVAGETLVSIEWKKRKVGIWWQLLWKWHFEALSSRKWGPVRHEATLFSLITFLVRPPEGTAHSPW